MLTLNKNPPKNWGDWRQCELCGVVQPPKSLNEELHCVDKARCAKTRSASSAAVSVANSKESETPH